jgi:hypothetical protein
MVFNYVIDVARKAAVVTMSGSVHGADIQETLTSIYADIAWGFGFSTFWDATNIRELHLEQSDLPAIVDLQRQHAATAGPGADVIVASRALDQTMAKIYALLAKHEPRKTYVCSTRDEGIGRLRQATMRGE